MNDWGLLPDDVYALIIKREWTNHGNLQKRLTGERAFPISISLKLPTDKQATANIKHFQSFISNWQKFQLPELVVWVNKNYRSLKNQQVPKQITIPSMQVLLNYLGKKAVARGQGWELRMQPLLHQNKAFYPVLIKHLLTLEDMSLAQIASLVKLLPQLSENMGQGIYLRALPLVGIDTKFVESYMALISGLLNVKHHNQIKESGDLSAWLSCQQNPTGWLTIRALSEETQEKLGGFSILQLPTDELRNKALPADNILIVENLQSGLGLPALKNTIAVIGGGRNVSWMNATWLENKRVAYWGDIDTWGLLILSEARLLLPHLVSLMMNESTLVRYQQQMVEERKKHLLIPSALREDEKQLFIDLQKNVFDAGRLEQEKLPADFCYKQLTAWLQGE